MPQSGYITTGSQQLHYLKAGNGPQLLLAFHGYSNSAWLWMPLAERLSAQYTTISIDLPHHGRSAWKEGKPWTKDDVRGMVNALMKEARVTSVTLAGFSLGGRICLTVLDIMPEAVTRILLVAPDGLNNPAFYHFVTRNAAGKRLFTAFLQKPDSLLRLAGWAVKRGWLSESQHRFFSNYVSMPQARAFLGNVWPSLRLLVPDRQRARRNIVLHHISTHIFMGRYDKVIPPQLATAFAHDTPEIRVQILEQGHHLMTGSNLALFAGSLTTS